MSLSRRSILKSAGALPLPAGPFGFEALGFQALAQTAPAAPAATAYAFVVPGSKT